MTVEIETSRVVHIGDGDTGPFAIPFYFLDNADVKVIKVTIADGTEDELTLDTDYTLDGEGDEDGGTLTLTDALSSDYRLVIYRDPAALQETRYPRNDPFPSASHEMVADRLTMIVQRVLSLVERGLRQPDGDSDDIDALPAKANRASKYLAFDADGNPIATDGTTEENPVSSFMATVLDDETAAAVLTTLGVSAFAQTILDDTTAAAARTTLDVPSNAEAILDTLIDAKGDLIAGSAADTPARVAVGADGTLLTADSSAAGGVAWSAAGFTTGDVKITLKTTADAGWVLMDDGTIGNASSGGTTRANADTEDLFTLLWNNTADAQCAVSTGRGASAAADFAANKTIALPKALGRALAVYGSGSGLTARALALVTGEETHTLTIAEMPAHDHPGSTVNGGLVGGGNQTAFDSSSTSATDSLQIASQGGDDPHNNMQPTLFLNVMIKL